MSLQSTTRRLPRFEHYFAGGSIAFGLGLVVNAILGSLAIDLLQPQDKLVQSVFSIVPYFVFSVFGSFLACRKLTERFVKAGLLIGLTAFLMHFGIDVLFSSYAGGLWRLFTYMSGALIGAKLAERKVRREDG